MAKKVKLNMSNGEAIAAVREASPAMANIIPDIGLTPTTMALESAYIAVSTIDQNMNEFVGTLVNLISDPYMVDKNKWNNPLEVFVKDKVIYGETVPVIAQNLVNRQVFRPVVDNNNPGEQFKAFLPDAKEEFFSINHRGIFPTTFTDIELRKAFLTDGGLSEFAQVQLNKLFDSAAVDEYQNTIKVMTDAYKFDKVVQVHIEDPTSSSDNAKALVKAIRSTVSKMKIYSTNYNRSEMDAFVNPRDLYLIITADVEAAQDVDVLATAFNMGKTEFLGHVLVIPSFGNTGVQALLCGRDAFVIIRTFYRTYTNFDAMHATRNVFLHDQLIFGWCSFVNAVAFTTDTVYDSSVTAVSVEAAGSAVTVSQGGTLKYTATVTGDSSNGVYWLVSGAKDESTYIGDDGTLYVGKKEPVGNTLTVTAYAAKNVQIKSTGVTVTVTA